MTHLKAKSIAEYSQKKFEEKVQKTLEQGAKKLNAAVERAEKYPMCTRLGNERETKLKLLDFIDWLRTEKGIWLCSRDAHGELSPIPARDEKVVHEYLEIDDEQLERERREMLEKLQEEA